MYLNIQILFFFVFINVFSQNLSNELNYKEDQIYFGISYISLKNNIDNFKQNGFSRSFFVGFINDFSLNKKGDLALGLGLGYSNDKYISNLEYSFDELKNSLRFKVPNEKSDFKNYIKTHSLELPFQFRWRNSTIDTYQFWRIYLGYKLKYIFYNRFDSIYFKKNKLNDITNFNQSINLSLGYNTWNIFIEYYMKSIIKINDFNQLNPIKIGLIFYIL